MSEINWSLTCGFDLHAMRVEERARFACTQMSPRVNQIKLYRIVVDVVYLFHFIHDWTITMRIQQFSVLFGEEGKLCLISNAYRMKKFYDLMSYIRFDSSTRSCHSIIQIWRMRACERRERESEWKSGSTRSEICRIVRRWLRWCDEVFPFFIRSVYINFHIVVFSQCCLHIQHFPFVGDTHTHNRSHGHKENWMIHISVAATHHHIDSSVKSFALVRSHTSTRRSKRVEPKRVVCALCHTHSTPSTHCITTVLTFLFLFWHRLHVALCSLHLYWVVNVYGSMAIQKHKHQISIFDRSIYISIDLNSPSFCIRLHVHVFDVRSASFSLIFTLSLFLPLSFFQIGLFVCVGFALSVCTFSHHYEFSVGHIVTSKSYLSSSSLSIAVQ